MSEDITGDLDLLGDWLDAKGYTEEAGLCTRAMDEINKLRDGVRSTIQERDVLSGENWELRAENEKLRDMLLRSDKLTRQEWYDMRNTQLAHGSNADAYKEAGDD